MSIGPRQVGGGSRSAKFQLNQFSFLARRSICKFSIRWFYCCAGLRNVDGRTPLLR